MGDLVARLVTWATEVIASIGYGGVAALIALETVFPPVPSEVILPLAGSLSASGKFNIFLMIIAATVGSMAGATLLYTLGRWGGEQRIGDWLDRYGKFILLSRADLEGSRRWFEQHGRMAVLVARVIPGTRTFVSVPAGIALMPYRRFLLFTAIGSGIWNGLLVSAGYFLGQNWNQVEGWLAPVGSFVYLLIAALLAFFIGRRLWSKFGPDSRTRVQD